MTNLFTQNERKTTKQYVFIIKINIEPVRLWLAVYIKFLKNIKIEG